MISSKYTEKKIKFKFTANSMISIDIKIIKKFFRVIKIPQTPIKNKKKLAQNKLNNIIFVYFLNYVNVQIYVNYVFVAHKSFDEAQILCDLKLIR